MTTIPADAELKLKWVRLCARNTAVPRKELSVRWHRFDGEMTRCGEDLSQVRGSLRMSFDLPDWDGYYHCFECVNSILMAGY